RGARTARMAGTLTDDRGRSVSPVKRRAALLSVGSNTLLILLKVVAGTVSGSVALLTEAMHSAVDLIASVVAYVSVRKADEPADALTSVGVLVGLILVDITGADWLDPAVALVVAAAIVSSGMRILTRSSRVLVDEALPASELDAIREEVVGFGPRGVAGFHAL